MTEKIEIEHEILDEMHNCFAKIIKNKIWMNAIKQNKDGFYVATKDEGVYFMKLGYKTQEEIEDIGIREWISQ